MYDSVVFSIFYIVSVFFIIAAPVHRLYPDQCKRNDDAVEVRLEPVLAEEGAR
jgi:hypothetical protein